MNGLKKNCTLLSHNERRALIESHNQGISIKRQSKLLGISRSSIYYQPVANEQDKQIMNFIDTIYTDCPFYGSRKIKRELKTRYGISICRDHIRRLMRVMGLEAIYPKSKRDLSLPNIEHKKYPYLLRGLIVNHPNQVWSTDITFIRIEKGWLYLVVIMDWYSRYVLSWRLSNSLEVEFCLKALKEALEQSIPEIFNSDQGSQFTSNDFTLVLEEKGIQISMDGRGRCLDNIFTERLWRTVKYENIYLKSYANPKEANEGLNAYFDFYNNRRMHQSLSYKTPAQIYFKKVDRLIY